MKSVKGYGHKNKFISVIDKIAFSVALCIELLG